MRILLYLLTLALVPLQSPARGLTPLVDHHQHLFSAETLGLSPRSATYEPLDAAGLVAYLDAAGIERAAVLSTAYQFGNPNRPPVENEYEKVKAENDWTSQQVARYPGRLRGLCGVNPLKDYALDELARCARDPSLRFGLKFHFGNSDVDLDNPAHVQQLQRVFRAANDRRMAVVVHMRSSVTARRAYGAKEARVFLNEVLPAAPDIPVQIAHLSGGGTLRRTRHGRSAVSVCRGHCAERSADGARVLRHLRHRRLREVDGSHGAGGGPHPPARHRTRCVRL